MTEKADQKKIKKKPVLWWIGDANTILGKIWRLILIIMIPLTLIAVVATVSLNRTSREYDQSVRNITAVNSYNVDWEKDFNSCMYYLIVEAVDWDDIKGNNTSDNPYFMINNMRDHFDQLAQQNDNPEIANTLDTIGRVLDNLEKCVDEVVSNLEEGGHYDDNMAILKTDIYVMTDLIQGDIETYIYLEAADMEKTRSEITRQSTITTIVLVILLVAVFLTAIFVSRRMAHQITDPIYGMVQATERFAGGDFSVRFEADTGDELEILANSFNDMVTEIKRLVDNVHRDEHDMRVLELRLLQEQVNPHFLYNTLDAIMWLTEAGENEKAVSMVNSLSNFFRTGLSKGRTWISVRDEESHTRSYLEIQQFRYQDILTYEIDIPEEIAEYYIMRLMLQPIVENALYHGIKNKRSGGHIIVKGEKNGGDLIFTVSDDGIGMKPERLDYVRKLISGEIVDDSQHGFGMANVEQRIHLRYGENYGITVESEYGKGTAVHVTVPVVTDPGEPGERSLPERRAVIVDRQDESGCENDEKSQEK